MGDFQVGLGGPNKRATSYHWRGWWCWWLGGGRYWGLYKLNNYKKGATTQGWVEDTMEFRGRDVATYYIAKSGNWYVVCNTLGCAKAGWSTQADWSGVDQDQWRGGHPCFNCAFNKGIRASSWPRNSSRVPSAACSFNKTTNQGSWDCKILLRPQQELGGCWVRYIWSACPILVVDLRFAVANHWGAHKSIFWWEGGRTAGRTM